MQTCSNKSKHSMQRGHDFVCEYLRACSEGGAEVASSQLALTRASARPCAKMTANVYLKSRNDCHGFSFLNSLELA